MTSSRLKNLDRLTLMISKSVVYHKNQCRDAEILQEAVISGIYAHLELEHELLQEVDSREDILTFRVSNMEALLADNLRGARVIRDVSYPPPSPLDKKNIWYEISLPTLRARSISVPAIRDDLCRLSASRIIVEGSSKYTSRFRLLKPLPLDNEEVQSLAHSCFQRALTRHEEEWRRHRMMLSWATSEGCLAARLAAHFNDKIPNDKCDNCSFCIEQRAADIGVKDRVPVDYNLLKQVMNICGSRRDLQFIARVAAGLTSPRIIHQGLHRHKLFRCLQACTFGDIMDALGNLCNGGEAGSSNRSDTEALRQAPVKAEESQNIQAPARASAKLEQHEEATPAIQSHQDLDNHDETRPAHPEFEQLEEARPAIQIHREHEQHEDIRPAIQARQELDEHVEVEPAIQTHQEPGSHEEATPAIQAHQEPEQRPQIPKSPERTQREQERKARSLFIQSFKS